MEKQLYGTSPFDSHPARWRSWLYFLCVLKLENNHSFSRYFVFILHCHFFIPRCIWHFSKLREKIKQKNKPTSGKIVNKWHTKFKMYFKMKLIRICVTSGFAAKYMRTALFWDVTQPVVAISCRNFGTTYRFHLQGSRIQKKAFCPNIPHSLPPHLLASTLLAETTATETFHSPQSSYRNSVLGQLAHFWVHHWWWDWEVFPKRR